MSNIKLIWEIPVYNRDAFIINGRMSPFIKRNHLPVILLYFANYLFSTIRGADHWVYAEAYDDTLALLKSYLDR